MKGAYCSFCPWEGAADSCKRDAATNGMLCPECGNFCAYLPEVDEPPGEPCPHCGGSGRVQPLSGTEKCHITVRMPLGDDGTVYSMPIDIETPIEVLEQQAAEARADFETENWHGVDEERQAQDLAARVEHLPPTEPVVEIGKTPQFLDGPPEDW